MRKTILLVALATSALLLTSFSQVATVRSLNSDWQITIDGAVQTPLNFTIDDLTNMQQTTVQAELYCYGYLLMSGEWTGVTLDFLLKEVGVEQLDEFSIDFKASDGYTIKDFPMSAAIRNDVIIAYEKDGMPLNDHVRLVVPGANGNVWISGITQISIKAAAGVPLEDLTPPLSPSMSIPENEANTSSSDSSQNNINQDQSLQSTTNDIPLQQTQNQTIPEQTGTQSSSPIEQQESVDSMQHPLEYSYLLLAIAIALSFSACLFLLKRKRAGIKQ